jgi:hypothetical protein
VLAQGPRCCLNVDRRTRSVSGALLADTITVLQAASAIIKEQVEPILKQYKPPVFLSIKFNKVRLPTSLFTRTILKRTRWPSQLFKKKAIANSPKWCLKASSDRFVRTLVSV